MRPPRFLVACNYRRTRLWASRPACSTTGYEQRGARSVGLGLRMKACGDGDGHIHIGTITGSEGGNTGDNTWRCVVQLSMPRKTWSEQAVLEQVGMPRGVIEDVDAGTSISPGASVNTLPCSATMMRARSSLRSPGVVEHMARGSAACSLNLGMRLNSTRLQRCLAAGQVRCPAHSIGGH